MFGAIAIKKKKKENIYCSVLGWLDSKDLQNNINSTLINIINNHILSDLQDICQGSLNIIIKCEGYNKHQSCACPLTVCQRCHFTKLQVFLNV